MMQHQHARPVDTHPLLPKPVGGADRVLTIEELGFAQIDALGGELVSPCRTGLASANALRHAQMALGGLLGIR